MYQCFVARLCEIFLPIARFMSVIAPRVCHDALAIDAQRGAVRAARQMLGGTQNKLGAFYFFRLCRPAFEPERTSVPCLELIFGFVVHYQRTVERIVRAIGPALMNYSHRIVSTSFRLQQ